MSNSVDEPSFPCEGGIASMTKGQIDEKMSSLSDKWKVEDQKHLVRSFVFVDFQEAIKFVNKVAVIAEEKGHHPDIAVHWNKVDIDLWTHAINGLSEQDFILAAKIDTVI